MSANPTQDDVTNFFQGPTTSAAVSGVAERLIMSPFDQVSDLGDSAISLRNALAQLRAETQLSGSIDETSIVDQLNNAAMEQIPNEEARTRWVSRISGKVASWLSSGLIGPIGSTIVDMATQTLVDRTAGPALENALIRTGVQVQNVRWRRMLAERGAKPILGAIGVLSVGLTSVLGNSIYNLQAGLSGESEEYINNWYEFVAEDVAETITTDAGPVQIEFLSDEINSYNIIEYNPPVVPSPNLPKLGMAHPGLNITTAPERSAEPPTLPGVELKNQALSLIRNMNNAALDKMDDNEIISFVRSTNLEVRELEDILAAFNKLSSDKKGRGNKGVITDAISMSKKIINRAKKAAEKKTAPKKPILEEPIKRSAERSTEPPTKQEATKAAYDFVRSNKLSGEYNKQLKEEIDTLFINSIIHNVEKKLIIKQNRVQSFNKQSQRATRPHNKGLKIFFNNPSNFI